MATKKEEALYVRNGTPNGLVLHINGMDAIKIRHRGHREDSTSLPIDALNDKTVSRWLKDGRLEKISRDAFMKLGARKVDVAPNEFLKRDRIRNSPKGELAMQPAVADTTRSLSQVNEGDVHKAINDGLTPKWAGDLMTTEEELETFDYSSGGTYPSHHRDSDVRREMGY